MPRVHRVAIGNYKSLKQVELRLSDRVTILTGRNNSGKSNVIDALVFLQELTTGDASGAIQRRGGYDQLVHGRNPAERIEFAIDLEGPLQSQVVRTLEERGVPVDEIGLLEPSESWLIQYAVQFRGETEFKESLALGYRGLSAPLVQAEFSGGNYTAQYGDFVEGTRKVRLETRLNFPRAKIISTNNVGFVPGLRVGKAPDFCQQLFIELFQIPMNSLVQRIGPIRNPQERIPISGPAALYDDGSNLADWLDYLRSNAPRKFQEFVNEFVTHVPEASGLFTPRIGGPTTTVEITETWFPELRGFDLGAASIGERNILVLVGHLVSDRRTLLLAVEEPENNIHPAAQRGLARAFWRHAERRQVILSSHSPTIASAYPIESVYLVTRGTGASEICKVDSGNIRHLLGELGVRPGDILDQEVIIFVEGETDERVFSIWYETLRRQPEFEDLARTRCLFVGARGLTNIPFYLDARILQARPISPGVYVIADGDVFRTSDQWRMVRSHLPLTDQELFGLLPGSAIEDYLLVPETLSRAYPDLFPTSGAARDAMARSGYPGAKAKVVLTEMLASVGIRYGPEAASRIAEVMTPVEIREDLRTIMKGIVQRVHAQPDSRRLVSFSGPSGI